MNRKELIEKIKTKYQIEPDHPWFDNPESAVFRHQDNRKWFALVMDISLKKLQHDAQDQIVTIMNIKCDALLADFLRKEKGIHPAYHMNKEKWISIEIENSLADDKIMELLHESFLMTASSTKKQLKNKMK